MLDRCVMRDGHIFRIEGLSCIWRMKAELSVALQLELDISTWNETPLKNRKLRSSRGSASTLLAARDA